MFLKEILLKTYNKSKHSKELSTCLIIIKIHLLFLVISINCPQRGNEKPPSLR